MKNRYPVRLNTVGAWIRAATLTFALVTPATVTLADQTNPRLDDLFAELTQESLSDSDAQSITNEIWKIWHETEQPEAARRFDSALQLMRFGHLEEAVSQFSHVISIAPEFAEAWNKRATLYWMMGESALSAKDVKKTLELEPRHFGALSGLGMLYSQLEQNGAAIKAFEEALTVNPHLPAARRNLETLKEQTQGDATSKPST